VSSTTSVHGLGYFCYHDMDDPVASVENKEFSTSHDDSKAALTPPTSEEWNKYVEGDSDNLSDLGFDDEDELPIEPDHYWGGGRVPVFKPVGTCAPRGNGTC